jgi:simple sugar transport system permease protein
MFGKTAFAGVKDANRNNVMLIALAVLIFVAMAILSPRAFLRPANLQGMCVQFPEFGIMAFGMMLAMISGGIDLSLVGIANLSSIVGAVVMLRAGDSPYSVALGILAALLVGALCGTFNGVLVGYLKIPAMLVTLCGLQLYTGLSLAITRGPAITDLPESFGKLANSSVFGVPAPVIAFVVVALVVSFLLRCTVYGQHLSFVGTNSVASAYSGIDNLRVTIRTYLLSGVLGSISGAFMSSHYNSAKSDYGKSYTLLTLLIVVLGGTDPNGGKGNVMGVALAVIALQLVSSAFNIMRINAFVKAFVWGAILLVVILVTKAIESRKSTR